MTRSGTFARLSCVQEYGFHSGIDELMWVTDHVNGALINLELVGLSQELAGKSLEWVEMVIRHATDNGAFLPERSQSEDFEETEAE